MYCSRFFFFLSVACVILRQKFNPPAKKLFEEIYSSRAGLTTWAIVNHFCLDFLYVFVLGYILYTFHQVFCFIV